MFRAATARSSTARRSRRRACWLMAIRCDSARWFSRSTSRHKRALRTRPTLDSTLRMQQYDLIIVGGGPAGLAAASHAHSNAIRYVLLERTDHLADTVYNYQARKAVMSEPMVIPTRGDLPFRAGSRESILNAWKRHADERKLNVEYRADVKSLRREGDRFLLKTAAGTEFSAARVIVAMGTQGNARKLGVPGEDLPHVFY